MEVTKVNNMCPVFNQQIQKKKKYTESRFTQHGAYVSVSMEELKRLSELGMQGWS